MTISWKRSGVFFHNCAYKHFLAYMQMLEVTLLKTCFIDFVFSFIHLTPSPLLVNPVCHSLTGVNFIPPMSILSFSYQFSLTGKDTFALLSEMDPFSPKWMLILEEAPMVIETKIMLLIPALQPTIDDTQYQCPPAYTLSPHQEG